MRFGYLSVLGCILPGFGGLSEDPSSLRQENCFAAILAIGFG